jgi:hypothetical protein
MNMLYEGLKKNNATIVIVPSTAVELMQLGGLAGVTAVTAMLDQERPSKGALGPWSAAAPAKPLTVAVGFPRQRRRGGRPQRSFAT